jgi:hypothetical protein
MTAKISIFQILAFDDVRCQLCGQHFSFAGYKTHGRKHVRNGEAVRTTEYPPRIVANPATFPTPTED